MAHIQLPPGLPGIVGPLTAYPATGKLLSELAETLLRSPSTLSMAERETIATFVSSRNNCHFCMSSHAAAARAHWKNDAKIVDQVIENFRTAPVTPKFKNLLAIAEKVQMGGRTVSDELVRDAKKSGATDDEIHQTVLIAAAFCMYNRYVDGLATEAPLDQKAYVPMGERLAFDGYLTKK